MTGHQSPHRGATNEWLTPPHIIDALGPFDLDPCSPITRPWPTATHHYTIDDDGLALPWHGFVWCNPPYGPDTGQWLERMCEHRNGIALVFARTETAAFFGTCWPADALLFLRGRLYFHRPDGSRAPFNAGAPSVLCAYGSDAVARLDACGLPGAFVSAVAVTPDERNE